MPRLLDSRFVVSISCFVVLLVCLFLGLGLVFLALPLASLLVYVGHSAGRDAANCGLPRIYHIYVFVLIHAVLLLSYLVFAGVALPDYFGASTSELPRLIRQAPLVTVLSLAIAWIIFYSCSEFFSRGFFHMTHVLSFKSNPNLKVQVAYFMGLYFMFILVFALLYHSSYKLDPGSFSHQVTPLRFHDFLYFSVVTITTLGYGEIVPKAGVTKLLTVIEVLGSVLFLLIYLAYIMSNAGAQGIQRTNSDAEDRVVRRG